MRIINLSDLDPDWCWLRDEFRLTDQEWLHYSSLSLQLPKILPKKDSIARAIAALRAVIKAKSGKSMLVSHGPRPAYYGASFAKTFCPDLPHLVYSFNFTNLPQGAQHILMAKAYQQPMRFVTYSTVERSLYADYFDIPIEKIDMLHWAVHAPKIDLTEKPIETGSYVCALGSQGRDYKTLFEAMKKLPHIRLVVVASQISIQHLSIPSNVTVYSNIPLSQAHNILAHSQFMALPLRDAQVPCGHVTIVSGMFFRKAIVVTNSIGVHDYIKDGITGLFCAPLDVNDFAHKIESLWENANQLDELSEAGQAFAYANCTEKKAIDYFADFIKPFS
ncbi:MAG: glycosyltransferase family 4 protein [Methylotenera sp.]